MSSVLDRIFAAKRVELASRQQAMPIKEMIAAAAHAPTPKDFAAALAARRPAIIAEIKRASPSKGDILPDLDPAAVARDYESAGAAALSVLTDVHFKGTLEDLQAVRGAVDIPLLRKDFMFDPYQVYEARAAGADSILLIVAMLEPATIHTLAALAAELGMAAIVEVHNRAERAIATDAGARLIGINNRDLHTFHTTLATTEELLADYRGDALIVAESGIETAADIRRLSSAGAHAFLIGESLLRGGNPRARLAELAGAIEPNGG